MRKRRWSNELCFLGQYHAITQDDASNEYRFHINIPRCSFYTNPTRTILYASDELVIFLNMLLLLLLILLLLLQFVTVTITVTITINIYIFYKYKVKTVT